MYQHKRVLALLIAILLTFSACSQAPSQTSTESGEGSESATNSQTNADSSEPILDLPLTTEEVTFTMFMPGLDNLMGSPEMVEILQQNYDNKTE